MLKLLPSVLLVFLLGSLVGQDFAPVTTVCRVGTYELRSPLTDGITYLYRWERSFDGGGSWSATGGNTPSLTVNSPTPGIRYRLGYATSEGCLADDGCRSLTSATELSVRIPTFAQGHSLCTGDTLFVGNVPLTTAGRHETILSTNSGCDSIVSTFLQLRPATNRLFFVDLCPGETFRGRAIGADTTISETFTAASGCDSTLTFAITVGFSTRPEIVGPDKICAGETARLEVRGAFADYAWSTGGSGRNIVVSAPGNYQLSLTDFTGCQLLLDHQISQTELTLGQLTLTPPACPGQASGRIGLQATGDTDLLYSIDGGATFRMDTAFTNLVAGTYDIVVENADGCRTTASATLAVAPALQLFTNLPAEQTIERGDSVFAVVSANFDVTDWRWNAAAFVSCNDCPATVLTPAVETRFRVEATAMGGCSVADSFLVRVNDGQRYYAPTAFSPNGDDQNDVWRLFTGPRAEAISGFQVADRWGGVRYQQPVDDIPPTDLGWDGNSGGEPMPPGTYVWSASIRYRDGERQIVRGQITLLR